MKLMTIDELSAYLNVKPKTLYDWTYKKQIPYLKLGRLVRFDQEEIDKWMKEKHVRKDWLSSIMG
jgi:excisionase family DNA binding protein